ncbi:DUF2304 domain-containing protein [Streptomyces sp. SID3343]|uniref:DUF2304 domain-containing protein n=1 Tax=Streptomyces sp. SID3343 TaxID=2690260 RepID=UPI00136CD365|nr:DUF2304 domain-containing protein [Streptomyces sp. SID3343]MYW01597.1 DUF2304 family protein [Streptomyces sp. SID3343]
MLIQILLLAGAAGLLAVFVVKWDKVGTRAWKRVAFMLFVGANVYAVLRPEDTTWVANKVGVGRGTDLILYLLVVGVAFMTLNSYMRFRSLEKKITDLARSVAISEAQLLNATRTPEEDDATSTAVESELAQTTRGSERS